jgi:hypothetical protein
MVDWGVRARHLRGCHDVGSFWCCKLVNGPTLQEENAPRMSGCLPADEYVPDALGVLYGLGWEA